MTEETKARVRVEQVSPGSTIASVEGGVSYTDGYHVTVGWSDEDNAWLARLHGVHYGSVLALADGQTVQEALLSLCCALAATIDSFHASPPATP